jgi:hypothetical protein
MTKYSKQIGGERKSGARKKCRVRKAVFLGAAFVDKISRVRSDKTHREPHFSLATEWKLRDAYMKRM